MSFDLFIEELASGSIKRLQERHLMRYFTTPEIAWLGDMNGFRILSAEEWLTGKAPSTDTWGVCYVMRRTAS